MWDDSENRQTIRLTARENWLTCAFLCSQHWVEDVISGKLTCLKVHKSILYIVMHVHTLSKHAHEMHRLITGFLVSLKLKFESHARKLHYGIGGGIIEILCICHFLPIVEGS